MGSSLNTEIFLNRPMYTTAEASRLVDISPVRVRRWLQGYSYEYGSKIHSQRPVVSRTESQTNYASFLDLIDLLFAKKFIDHGISLQKLRKALDEAHTILGTDHFASQILYRWK